MAEIETTELGDLEEFVVARLNGSAELLTALDALGDRQIYAGRAQPNDAEGRKAVLVFNVVPLEDKQGQTRRFNSKALVDLKLIIDGGPSDATERALAIVDELFRYVNKAHAGNHVFSTRGARAIYFREPSPNAERDFWNRGRTYSVVMNRA